MSPFGLDQFEGIRENSRAYFVHGFAHLFDDRCQKFDVGFVETNDITFQKLDIFRQKA
jgi:hypothetical protein